MIFANSCTIVSGSLIQLRRKAFIRRLARHLGSAKDRKARTHTHSPTHLLRWDRSAVLAARVSSCCGQTCCRTRPAGTPSPRLGFGRRPPVKGNAEAGADAVSRGGWEAAVLYATRAKPSLGKSTPTASPFRLFAPLPSFFCRFFLVPISLFPSPASSRFLLLSNIASFFSASRLQVYPRRTFLPRPLSPGYVTLSALPNPRPSPGDQPGPPRREPFRWESESFSRREGRGWGNPA